MSAAPRARPHRERVRRPVTAALIAVATLVLGPLALSLTFAAGSDGAASDAPGAVAFAASSLLLAAIWALGGLAVIVTAGPDRAVRTVGRGRAALIALGAGSAVVLGALVALVLLMLF